MRTLLAAKAYFGLPPFDLNERNTKQTSSRSRCHRQHEALVEAELINRRDTRHSKPKAKQGVPATNCKRIYCPGNGECGCIAIMS